LTRGGERKTRVILVYRRDPFEKSRMDELKSLAEAAGYEVIGSLEQVRRPPPALSHRSWEGERVSANG
jgi:50S ribosomal subunit-associated GTPase HflX